MNFNVTKKLVFAAILVLLSQNSSFAVDDVWGGMGISDDSIQYNNDYANTVFEKSFDPSEKSTSFTINGYNNAVLKIYLNDKLAKEQKIDF